MINILYEDNNFLVVDKPSGILTIATEEDSDNSNNLYDVLLKYVKKKSSSAKLYVVHRLDRDTSGIVIFAKNEVLKRKLQDNWDKLVTNREYIAIVDGTFKKKKDTLKDYLKESKTLQVYVTDDTKNGKLAITDYEVIKENRVYSMLKINIHTGRKNQIRVQLENINHPVVGDKKYKSRNNPLGRLALHATKLEIIHPLTKKKMLFECKIPEVFNKMFDE